MSTIGEPYPLREPERSTGELVGRLSHEFGDLVKTHIELAKVETKEEAKRAGKGAGLLTGAAVAALLALVFLSSALAWGLDEGMPTWLAFLIVGAVWLVAAAAFGMAGRSELARLDPAPRQTLHELKEDRQWLTEQRS